MLNIRNFCIIAHIDHGKSTLADRMLELTGTIEARKMKTQYLDQLDLERERGITIKMAPVRMEYKNCILNLIDTPGHNDFSYEVSRALAAVEGAVLLVDATQGIQAQTLANFVNAQKAGLKIIGAVNKIDMNPERLEDVIINTAKLIGAEPEDIARVSGKTGFGVEMLLDKIISDIPPPLSRGNGISRALIFDSLYDDHKGDIAYVRVFDGEFKAGNSFALAATNFSGKIKEVGIFNPELKPTDKLTTGLSGYIATGLKDPHAVRIGDTLYQKTISAQIKPLPGYHEPMPVVFVSFYPAGNNDYDDLVLALEKLKLNDSALVFEPDRSEVLGRGFKCGFLGRLHFEIVIERLKREFDLDIVTSFPSVAYEVETDTGKSIIYNPKDFPDNYNRAWQPMVLLAIITPPDYVNSVLQLGQVFHFASITTENFGDNIIIHIKMPLADLIRDFDDKLKSISGGFASFSYEFLGNEVGEVDKLEILIAGESISGLTRVVARDEIEKEGRAMVEKLKELLPKQQFAQALQAKARGRIVARETIPAMRKDVTGYLYGGDRTRKMKLWKKQQKGKKKLAERGHGSINIPPDIFQELLKK